MEKKFDLALLTNYIFSFFPISFIIGNAAVNLNLILFIILGIFHLKSKILKIKFDFLLKVILLFFLVILISTGLSLIKSFYSNEIQSENLNRLIKSVLFFRYFIMLLIVYALYEHDVLNFKYFFITATVSSFLISIDIIYQYFFGFNIIGLERVSPLHNTGFFTDEKIAGGFIQNFSFFAILFVSFLFRKKIYTKYLLTGLMICILGLAIFVSGNRMPFLLFLVGLVLTFIFKNDLRKIIPATLIILLLIINFLVSKDELRKMQWVSFYDNSIGQVILMKGNLIKKNEKENLKLEKAEILAENKQYEDAILTKDEEEPYYLRTSNRTRLLITSLDIWKRNKIIGNGLKSYQIDCFKLFRDNPDYNIDPFIYPKFKKNRTCGAHPHNYYFQTLSELGIIGLAVLLIIAFLFAAFTYKNFKFLKRGSIENYIIIAAIISLFLEMFPLKSAGNIFSTNNTTYIIVITSILIGCKKVMDAKIFK